MFSDRAVDARHAYRAEAERFRVCGANTATQRYSGIPSSREKERSGREKAAWRGLRGMGLWTRGGARAGGARSRERWSGRAIG